MEKRLLILGLKRVVAGSWHVTRNHGHNLLVVQAGDFSPVTHPFPVIAGVYCVVWQPQHCTHALVWRAVGHPAALRLCMVRPEIRVLS